MRWGINAAGGVTIVQGPRAARYDGMPRARSRPAVSLILSPQEMGAANRLVVAEGEDTEAQHLFVLHEGAR